jgi:two-component system, NarL family, sensor histidine kinase UhpB
MPLFWRVLATNAAVLALATTALAVSPATVSQPVAVREAIVLSVGIAVMLVLNLVLLRRALAPLQRLTRVMRSVDPLRPGHRIPVYGPDAEVAALTESFNDMLDRLETERRDSALRALAAQEGERRRIARELHDEIGQALTAVLLQLERTARAVPDGGVQVLVVEAREDVRDALDDVRRIARELRPEALDDLGLASALAALTVSLAERADVCFDRRIDRDLPELSPEVELVLYRVAQESLTNVARHADASNVELSLTRVDGGIELRVRDDGRGFDSSSAGPINGIRGMRERAVLIGARLALDSRPGDGTEVRLRVSDAEAA